MFHGVEGAGSAHWPTNSEFDSCQLTRRSLCNTIEWDIVALITNKVGHSCLSMDAQRIRTAQKQMMSILFVSRLYYRHTWLPNPQVAFPTRESERICEVSEQFQVLFSFSISHTLHCQLILTLNGVQQTENHKKIQSDSDNVVRLIKTDSQRGRDEG